jgi:hypothetical protein
MKQHRNKSLSRPFYSDSFRRYRLLAVLAAMLVAMMPRPTELHAAPLESFLLFYSNNILGETEPCG